MKYTPTEVLNSIENLTRKRLYEMMKQGDISYEVKNWGKKTRRFIDASELIRVFGDKFFDRNINRNVESVSEKQNDTLGNVETNKNNNDLLDDFLKSKDEKIEDLKQTIIELKKERDDWKDQAKKLLLTSSANNKAQSNILFISTIVLLTVVILGLFYYVFVFW